MKHIKLTLPNDWDYTDAIINALNRGVQLGEVIPHPPRGEVREGDTLEFDTANAELLGILDRTSHSPNASRVGFAVEVTDADHGNPALN